MEEKKLNLDAPFLSVRRIPTKPEISSESENTKKTTTTRRRKVKDSCKETEHETLVRLLQDDQSFDHVMEPSLVPFLWEQIPGKPKDHHTLIEESDLIKALEMVSSTASFSVNCSIDGVSDELEKNDDRSSNVSRDDVILEYRDLIMSRFLPAAQAIALKQKKESSLDQEEIRKKKKKRSITLQRVSMAINQGLNNDEYDHNHVDGVNKTDYSDDSKTGMFGFLPRFCSKSSLDVLNPVLSRVKTCQNLAVKPGKIINPKSQDSFYKTKSASPRILRSNKIVSQSQEFFPIPRFSTELSKTSKSKSGEIIRIQRNTSRLQRTSSDQIQRQDTRFLVEEVKRMRNRNKTGQRISLFLNLLCLKLLQSRGFAGHFPEARLSSLSPSSSPVKPAGSRRWSKRVILSL
ncbi:hypothetical protein EUTSA_v10000904mg [Eutrema salsugineum]|uniref:Uncharacterized protein n=1 Tax=Eutrema salsugineum TaxID=72664 RepID=V4LIW2_EUTSA|nr:hypothetical protein EUTSA_v10000904mg [Eutrema salsugineum]